MSCWFYACVAQFYTYEMVKWCLYIDVQRDQNVITEELQLYKTSVKNVSSGKLVLYERRSKFTAEVYVNNSDFTK